LLLASSISFARAVPPSINARGDSSSRAKQKVKQKYYVMGNDVKWLLLLMMMNIYQNFMWAVVVFVLLLGLLACWFVSCLGAFPLMDNYCFWWHVMTYGRPERVFLEINKQTEWLEWTNDRKRFASSYEFYFEMDPRNKNMKMETRFMRRTNLLQFIIILLNSMSWIREMEEACSHSDLLLLLMNTIKHFRRWLANKTKKLKNLRNLLEWIWFGFYWYKKKKEMRNEWWGIFVSRRLTNVRAW